MNEVVEVFCETDGSFGMLLQMERKNALPFAVAFLQAENAKQITIGQEGIFIKGQDKDLSYLLLHCMELLERREIKTTWKTRKP